MKTMILFCASLLFILLSQEVSSQGGKYGSVDLNKILGNDRVLSNYIKCILDKGPCTPEARDLKRNIPKGLETLCGDCSADDKYLVSKASAHVIKNRPEDWNLIVQKYDPERKYVDKYLEFVKENYKE